jgi:chromate transport protein ChrA
VLINKIFQFLSRLWRDFLFKATGAYSLINKGVLPSVIITLLLSHLEPLLKASIHLNFIISSVKPSASIIFRSASNLDYCMMHSMHKASCLACNFCSIELANPCDNGILFIKTKKRSE